MPKQTDSRIAAPPGVSAALAELDAKLAALERGMALGDGSRGPHGGGTQATGSLSQDGLPADGSGRGPEPAVGADVDASTPVAPTPSEADRQAAGEASAAAAAAPSVSDGRVASVAVGVAELAGWRERLRRAVDELTALQVEIELAARRQAPG